MSDATTPPPYHDDSKKLLDALRLAESVTGFVARLIEKDYYCSVVLQDFGELFRDGLVFKGGTSLSKVHAEFFRLSEDLDFSVSVSPDASRGVRRKAVEPFKNHFAGVTARLACFKVADALVGHNDSRQYTARLAYRSAVTGEDEFLKIEVGLREEILVPAVDLPARTLLVDPNTRAATVPSFNVRVLTLQEAYAEKVRAALTRRDPAIRDFFDVDNAVQTKLLEHLEPNFLGLVAKKLAVTADPIDTSLTKVNALKTQLEAQLKPVLRTADYEAFALDRAIATLEAVATRCQKS
jgi:predicted nucleotidyltransferase component of viral defense system